MTDKEQTELVKEELSRVLDQWQVLTFKVSNLTTEKEVANAEIDRLKEANEHWHTIVSFHKTDMDAVTGKLTAANAKAENLRKIGYQLRHAGYHYRYCHKVTGVGDKKCDCWWEQALADTEDK